MNNLAGSRCYLAGAMSYAPDGGVEWRAQIRDYLEPLKLHWFDPINRPSHFPVENNETRQLLHEAKQRGDYDTASEMMRKIRHGDLRMVILSDFVIAHIDIRVPTYGTMEELTLANQLGKPILIWCKQGKAEAPDWIFSMIPHQTIFSELTSIYEYLRQIDIGQLRITPSSRWCLLG